MGPRLLWALAWPPLGWLKPRESLVRIGGKARFAEFSVGDDVDPTRDLLAHHRGDGTLHARGERFYG